MDDRGLKRKRPSTFALGLFFQVKELLFAESEDNSVRILEIILIVDRWVDIAQELRSLVVKLAQANGNVLHHGSIQSAADRERKLAFSSGYIAG